MRTRAGASLAATVGGRRRRWRRRDKHVSFTCTRYSGRNVSRQSQTADTGAMTSVTTHVRVCVLLCKYPFSLPQKRPRVAGKTHGTVSHENDREDGVPARSLLAVTVLLSTGAAAAGRCRCPGLITTRQRLLSTRAMVVCTEVDPQGVITQLIGR